MRAEIIQRYHQGAAINAIARELRVGKGTVRSTLVDAGIAIRPKGRPAFRERPTWTLADAAPPEPVRIFCEQCERRMRPEVARLCGSQFCKAPSVLIPHSNGNGVSFGGIE